MYETPIAMVGSLASSVGWHTSLAAPAIDLLLELVSLILNVRHHLQYEPGHILLVLIRYVVPHFAHQIEASEELVRKPSDDRGPPSCSGMARSSNDVLSCEQPVPPSEAADMLQQSQVEHCCLNIAAAVVSQG